MPELPDVTVYVEPLERHVVGRRLEGVRLASASLSWSVEPPPAAVAGRRVVGTSRLRKRIVLPLAGDLHLVLHPTDEERAERLVAIAHPDFRDALRAEHADASRRPGPPS